MYKGCFKGYAPKTLAMCNYNKTQTAKGIFMNQVRNQTPIS